MKYINLAGNNSNKHSNKNSSMVISGGIKYTILTMLLLVAFYTPTHTSAYQSVNFNYDNQQAGVLSSLLNIFTNTSNAQTPDITTGLVGHWSFDETSGTTAGDSSGIAGDGALTGGPTWTTGQIGGALSFNGVDDSIAIGNDVSTYLNFTEGTISLWYKSQGSSNNPNFFTFTKGGDVIQINIWANTTLFLQHKADWGNSNKLQITIPSLTTDVVWHNVIVKWNVNSLAGGANTMSITYDGVETTSTTALTVPSAFGGTGFVGSSGGTDNFFNGIIDDVRIYNRALTAEEVTELYNYTGGPPPETCTSFTYTYGTCQPNSTQTTTVLTSSPSGCTGGTPTTSQSCTYTPPTPDTQAPTIPTNLIATPISSSQINLTWTASTDNTVVTGYNIYRDGTQIDTSSNSSYSDIGRTAETQYTYTVNAYDAVLNTSAQTASVNATTQSAPTILPAFPGAEGFGAQSVGGRGGTVVKVTNLNDSGAGSFREAVQASARHYAIGSVYVYEDIASYLARLDASGHKIIVFEVSGIINLQSTLNITYPYLTIAGETSPGGILITGYQTNVRTHDVIMRHMRFRVGSHRVTDGSNADPETLDSFDILGPSWNGGVPVYNIIVDHSSFSWGVDETFSVTGGAVDTTIQWSIFSEGLTAAGHPKGNHSKGLLISGKYNNPTLVSLHHNYIAHNADRNPYIFNPSTNAPDEDMIVDVVNNVAYNWKGGLSMSNGEVAKSNFVHNYVKQGIKSNNYSFEVIYADPGASATPLMYVEGNIGSTRLSQSDPQWNVGEFWTNVPLGQGFRNLIRWPAPLITTSIMSLSVANSILTDVGATIPIRDSVDTRVVADFAAGTGDHLANVIYPDDFPTFQNITPPTDADNDGMSDVWETTNGFNTSIDDSAGDSDGDGYTNIEEYLHYLAGGSVVVVPPTSADLNSDTFVNSIDWSILNTAWGTNNPTVDLNNDSTINSLDWSVMNAQWSM